MLNTKTRQALDFWASCYKAGVRFTIDGNKAMPSQCLSYWDRVDLEIGFGRFGEFMDYMPVEPEPWMVEGVIEHQEGLATLLAQKPPKPYEKYFYHLLVKDYECEPIREHAARNGLDIGWQGTSAGNFLMYNGQWRNKNPKTGVWEIAPSKGWNIPERSPVLMGIEKINL